MRRKTIRGSTLVEVMTSVTISTMVLIVGSMIFLFGSATWLQGAAKLDADSQSQRSVREIAMTLREAMSVIVDANGQGLSYRLPATDDNGTYLQPVVWDNINRRIQLNADGTITVTADNTPTRTFCSGVITTDPLSPGGTGTYKLFSAGSGAITRSLTIMVVTQKSDYRQQRATSRSRETIFLRNIPQLTE